MDLPFTRAEFLEVFVRYNAEIWPLQVLTIAVAGFVVGLALTRRATTLGDRAIALALAFFWGVSGLGFHLRHFTAVTPAAHIFGWASVAGAAALLWAAFARTPLAFRPPRGWRGALGVALIVYAIVVYPLLGAAAGHVYPAAPVLGVAPCPTTLLTVGLLLWASPPAPRLVLAVPFAWSIVALGAALKLGVTEDFGLLASAFGCVAAVTARRPGFAPGTAHAAAG
jgi:hypothetical protein